MIQRGLSAVAALIPCPSPSMSGLPTASAGMLSGARGKVRQILGVLLDIDTVAHAPLHSSARTCGAGPVTPVTTILPVQMRN